MTVVKYAVRALIDEQWRYRSRHSSYAALTKWEEAQLWDNPKTAAKEAKRLRDGKPEWVDPEKPWSLKYAGLPSATVVTVNIGEPE